MLNVWKTTTRADAHTQRTVRLVGVEALERAARVPGTQVRQWPSLTALGGEVDLEEAFRIAHVYGPQSLYVDVAVVD